MDKKTYNWLPEEVEMANLIRTKDWSGSPLGPKKDWPKSLQTALSICLNSKSAISIFWGDQLIHFYNDACKELIGKKHPSALGRPAREISGDSWKLITSELEQVLSTSLPRKSQNQLLSFTDNKRRYFDLSFNPIPDEQGSSVGGIFCIITKGTHSKDTESTFRQIFKSIPGLYLVLKPENYEIIAASDAYLEATQNERDDIIGKKIFANFPAPTDPRHDSMRKLQDSLEKVKTKRRADTMAITHHPISGLENEEFEKQWWSPINSPVFNKAGKVDYIIHRIEDVTTIMQQLKEEKEVLLPEIEEEESQLITEILLHGQDLLKSKDRAVKRLQKSEKKYRTLFDSIDEGFCIVKVLFDEDDKPVDYQFLETNPSFEKQTGIKDAEGKKMGNIAPEHEKEWYNIYGKVAKTREPKRFRKLAGALDRYFDVYAFPFGAPEERKVAILFKDITEQKEIEEALRESRKRLQTALEVDNVGILFWGSDFTITEVNSAFLCMSGFSYDELIGKTWQELTPKEFHAQSSSAVADIRNTGHTDPYETQYYRKDGSAFWGLVASRQINKNETVEYVVDITERKHKEESVHFLLKLNDRLRLLSDPNKIQNKATRVLGEHLNADRVLYIEAESDSELLAIKSDYTNGISNIIGKYHFKDFGASLMDDLREGHTSVIHNIKNEPKLVRKEKRNYLKFNIKSQIAVPLVKEGELVALLAVEQSEPRKWTDQEISLAEETAERTWAYVERSRAEEKLMTLKNNLEERVEKRTETLRTYQDHLRSLTSQLNKAEEKERHRIAAELHDHLGQMLTLSKMKVQSLKKNENTEDIDDINDLTELLDDALTYTRELISELKPPPALDKENFGEVLTWVAKRMKKYDLDVTIKDDGKEKPLSEDIRTTLHQSVRELLLNIVKHANVNEATIQFFREEDEIKIIVEDKGKGFNINDGNGLTPSEQGGYGLFNIQERLNWLGGSMEIFSKPGKGTKTILSAPSKEAEKTKMPIQEKEESGPTSKRRNTRTESSGKIEILLVDDHEMMRRGLRNMIEVQDDLSIVAEASDGEQAVKLAHEISPDIIIMDINMPVMNGIEATKKITSEIEDIQIIGLSLYKKEEAANNMLGAGASAFLTKDEAFETLSATIRSEAIATKSSDS